MEKKKCRACGEILGVENYYAHPETADRLQPNCRKCMLKAANARNKRIRQAKKKAQA